MKILLIDGNSILNRAFYGIKLLTNSKGFYTNAVTGFMNIYLKELDIIKPDCAAVAFDMKAPTFRHLACDFYKANRKGMPDELAQQLPVIKELLKDLGIRTLELEGWEADDILGSVSKLFADNGHEAYVLSGDRDNLQLIRDGVKVRLATTKETITFDRDKFFEHYGTEPINLIDIKALMGDSSDNIPGVAGVGEKTALSLIGTYGTIENLYDNLEDAPLTAGVKNKLANGKESAFQSKWLATISSEAPVSKNIDDYRFFEADKPAAAKLLQELEMFKLLDRLKLSDVEVAVTEAVEEISDDYTLCPLDSDAVNKISGKESFFTFDEKLAVLCEGMIYETDDEAVMLEYFACPSLKTTFDAKEAYKFAFKNNSELKNITFICNLAGYLLNSQAGDYTAKNLSLAYGVAYSADENYAELLTLPRLKKALETEINATNMAYLLYEVEQPLCEVLASMEVLGVKVDAEGIREFGEVINKDISRLEAEIYELAGKKFNISSPKQLGVVLFEDLGLPCKKKTKSGYSTSAEVLEELAPISPIVSLILEYRTLTKLASTYVDGLLEVVCDDRRVRSSFKQTETRTGRISSANPNMQNIPVRKEIGRNLRKFFIAKEGCVLLDADYSQIELRVLASMCGDENMIEIFHSGADIHTRTASQVFNLPEDFVDQDMRRAAKAVNFGIVYGIGAFSLSKDIGVSVQEADRYIKGYLANFPRVDAFMKSTVEDGIKNGYVKTLFERRRYIPELSNSNKNLQAFGKRAAMNAPIQGTAADIIKIAMVRVYKRLKEELPEAKLILQVHDELIIEAPETAAEKASAILSEEMQSAVSLKVPLVADVGVGRSWNDAKG
ncbi:MAG: DNA polymerase I [Oscillospiraceae bacterium]|nr:DNA polymerase I [Oscillospiraceae bacterium]